MKGKLVPLRAKNISVALLRNKYNLKHNMRDRNPDNSFSKVLFITILFICSIKFCFMYSTDSVLCIIRSRVNANDIFIWLQAIIIKLGLRIKKRD